jgi:hypothetical protein
MTTPNANSDLPPSTHHVFVDFENVHKVDPTIIGQKSVSFTLLVGARQTKIDAVLVEKLMQHANSVHLVRLSSTGRNALDFTLAYYVGRAVAADPTGFVHIMAKDTGYDALVTHLRSRHIRAHRHDDFASLATTCTPKPEIPATAVSTSLAPAKAGTPKLAKAPKVVAPVLDEHATHMLEHLRSHAKNQPRREKTLVSYIQSHFGKENLTEIDAQSMITTLKKVNLIAIDEKGRVTYKL